MTRPNTIKGDELYVRCIFCGDSKDHNHAHMTINLNTGLHNCFLCNHGGKVDHNMLLALQITDFPGLDYSTGRFSLPEIIRGPGSQRRSLLDRYHASTGDDVFYSWWNDAHVGYYLRGKMKRLVGFSGVNWAGAPEPLLSFPDQPLRFVEGPYDVLYPDNVCFFGIPSLVKIKRFFREHFFVLVPDGDLWTSQVRFKILQSLIENLIKENLGFVGVEFLPKVMDPDESPDVKFIPTEFFKEKLWRNTSLSLKAQQVLASLQ
jgi:hypothetical protein